MQVICYSKNSYIVKYCTRGNWNGAEWLISLSWNETKQYVYSQTTAAVELETKSRKNRTNMEEILNRKRAKQMKWLIGNNSSRLALRCFISWWFLVCAVGILLGSQSPRFKQHGTGTWKKNIGNRTHIVIFFFFCWQL